MTRIEWRRYGAWAAHLFVNGEQVCSTRHGKWLPTPAPKQPHKVTELTSHGTPYGKICARCMKFWNKGTVKNGRAQGGTNDEDV